jgi:OFA family oxalate/formate antiporter-like MFS transporter
VSGTRQGRFFYGYVLVFSGFLIMLSMYGTLYSFGVFLKPLLNEVGRTRAAVSGAYSLCFFLSGALAMVAGGLTDRIGPRTVIAGSGILIGSGYILLSRTNTLLDLYLCYGLLVGTGMSGGITPVLSTITKWFKERRGLMTGFVVAGVGTGTLIMPPIANALISAYGWRTSFLLLGMIVLAVITGLAQLFLGDPASKGLLPYGSEDAAGATGGCSVEGLSFHDACKTIQLWILFAIYVCSGFVIQAALVHTAIYAVSLGMSPGRAAMLLSVIGVGSLVGRVFGGAASDRFGNRLVMIIASILMAVQFSLLLLSSDTWALLLFAGLFGVVYGEILCMMPLLPAEMFGLRNHGAILGVIMFASTIGGGLGPVIAGVIFDVCGGYKVVWITCLSVSIATFILSASIRKVGGSGDIPYGSCPGSTHPRCPADGTPGSGDADSRVECSA